MDQIGYNLEKLGQLEKGHKNLTNEWLHSLLESVAYSIIDTANTMLETKQFCKTENVEPFLMKRILKSFVDRKEPEYKEH